MGDAVTEEAVLLLDDLGGDLEDRLLPLVERLHQPVGVGQLFGQPALGGLVGASAAQLQIVAAVDDQPRQRRLVDADVPAALAAGRQQDVGRHRLAAARVEPQAGLGIVAAQFGKHVGEVLVVDPAHAFEPRNLAARDEIEVVDQPRHRRVVAVRLARLQRDAFAQSARADAGRIERLHQRQRGFRVRQRDAEIAGQLEQGGMEIARLVEQADEMAGDGGKTGIVGDRADLRAEMLGQGLAAAGAFVDRWAVLTRGPTDLAAPVGLVPAVAGVAVAVERGRVDVERLVDIGVALADELVRARAFERGAARLLGRFDPGDGHFGRRLADVEQRVGLQRLADERLDLEVGQRQQLDRLLELRRHDQRLGLAEV